MNVGFSPGKYTHLIVAEVVGMKRIPLLGKGGVAAPIKKISRSHLNGRRRGGSFKRYCFGVLNEPPRPRLSRNGDIS